MLQPRHTKHSIDRGDFGLTWMPQVKTWKLSLGSNGTSRANSGPAHQEYFTVAKFGSKKAAEHAALERRDKLMRTKAMKEFYRYRILGGKVREPRSGASCPVTGVIFDRGLRDRGYGLKAYPRLIAYVGSDPILSRGLRTNSARLAFHDVVKVRYKEEGRRYIRSKVDKLFDQWIGDKEIKAFLLEYEVPIEPEEVALHRKSGGK